MKKKQRKSSEQDWVEKIVQGQSNTVDITVKTTGGKRVIYEVARSPIITYDKQGKIINW